MTRVSLPRRVHPFRDICRALRAAGLALALLVSPIASAQAFLPTTGDLANQALQMVVGQINQPGVFEIRLGRVGLENGTVRVDSLDIADADGVWFRAGSTRIDWSWRDALGGVARFRRIDIESVDILRPPVTDAPPPDPAAAPALATIPLPLLEDWPRAPIGVRVDTLILRRAALAPPVLGRAAAARIQASFRDVSDEQALTLSTETLKTAPTRLDLAWRLGFATPHAKLDLSLDQPAGGPFGAAAGLPPDLPLRLTVSGNGPLPGWTGRLSADAGAYGDLLADLALDADGPASTLLIAAGASPGQKLPALLRDLLGARPSLGLRAGWAPGTEVRLTDLHLRTRVAAVDGQARIGLSDETLQADLNARLLAPDALARLVSPLALDGAEGRIRLTGALSAPLLSLDATATGTRLDDLRVGRARLTGTVEGPLEAVRGRIDATLDDLTPEPLRQALGAAVTLRVAAEGDLTRALTLTEARLDSAAGHAEANGVTVTLQPLTVSGQAVAALPDLARFAPLIGENPDTLPLRGRTRLDITATSFGLEPAGPDSRIEVTGRLQDLQAPAPILAALLGRHASLSAQAHWQETDRLAIDGRLESAGGLGAAIDGSLDPTAGTGALAYRLGLTDLAPVARAADLLARGSLATSGRLTGLLADPSLDGSVEGNGLTISGIRLGRLAADYRLQTLATAPDGRLAARLSGGLLPISASTRLQARETGLTLDAIRISAAGNSLSGALQVPNGAPITGDLALDAPALGALLGPLGVPAAGRANGRLRLDGGSGGQTADLTLSLHAATVGDPAMPTLMLPAVALDASATLPAAGAEQTAGALPALVLEVRADGGRVADNALRNVHLVVRGPQDALTTGLDVQLEPPEAGRLAVRAGIDAAQPEQVRANLTSLFARYRGLEAALRRPARLTLTGDRQTLEDLSLLIGGGEGTLEGDLSLTPRSLQADLTLVAIPLAAFQSLLPAGIEAGRLDGRLDLVTGGNAAGGRLDATLDGLSVGGLVEDYRLDGRLTGAWDGRRANLTATLATPEQDTDLQLSGSLDLPADPAGPVPLPPPDATLTGAVRWQGEIAPIWALVPAPDHLLSGRADLEARVTGTLAEPAADGGFALTGGSYENLLTGTILKDLTLDAQLSRDLRVPWSLRATDGGRGRLTGEGTFVLFDDPLSASRAEITADRLLVMRRDDVTAQGSGRITLAPADTGPGARVAGRFETRFVEIRLVNALPPEIVTIEVERSDQPPQTRADAPPAGPPIALDLTLEVPGRAFVRGRGADMEWRGQATVAGTAAAPVVSGRFTALRGGFDFIGNSFDLEKGTVVVPSQGPPRVDLDFARSANGITGHILITGTATAPDIAFRSAPSLPESEVLPRLLFGANQQSLGPAEALQLADGLDTLASGRPGLSDRLRRTLRLDVLRVEAGETEGAAPTMTLGRRIDRNVFVGARQPTSSDAGSVFVEIEVLPDVKLETEVGATGESDASLVWEYKY